MGWQWWLLCQPIKAVTSGQTFLFLSTSRKHILNPALEWHTIIRLEKGTDRGIYPYRGTIPRLGYNKLHFFFTKSWKFLDTKKLIASRIKWLALVLQKCNIFYIRTITVTLVCIRSKKHHVVTCMRAKFTTLTFSESVGNGTEVLIQKLLRFLYCDATCN